jgi:hypothetical protein
MDTPQNKAIMKKTAAAIGMTLILSLKFLLIFVSVLCSEVMVIIDECWAFGQSGRLKDAPLILRCG